MKFWSLADNSWGAEERTAVLKVLDSGFVTMGTYVAEFEHKLAKLHHRRRAVMVNSGSSANLLAVAAFTLMARSGGRPIEPGDEAIVPAIAWSTTYAPLAQHGLRLRVVDVDPDTLGMDVEQMRAALNKRTRIIVGASILGFPARLNDMKLVAQENGLLFLEDNCESLGAHISGFPCGSVGDMSTTSFFFSHQVSTGEGGVVLTDWLPNEDALVCLRAHGWARDLPRHDTFLEPAGGYPTPFGAAYKFLAPGYNLRPTELAAAVGLVQLKRLPAMIETRVANWIKFRQEFDGDSRWRIQKEDASEPTRAVPFGFTLVMRTPEDRSSAMAAMDRAGIEYRMVTGGCFSRHPAARFYDWYSAPHGLRVAEHVHDCGFFVGNHPRDLSAQINKLYEVLDQVIAH